MKKIVLKPFEFVKKNWAFILLLIIYIVSAELIFHEICFFKITFGIPCPACGMTRAYKALFTLHIKKAFYYHPLFIMVPFLAIIILYSDFKHMNKIYNSKIFWLIILSIVILTYILRIIFVYPNSPMNINHDSILFKIIKLIKR